MMKLWPIVSCVSLLLALTACDPPAVDEDPPRTRPDRDDDEDSAEGEGENPGEGEGENPAEGEGEGEGENPAEGEGEGEGENPGEGEGENPAEGEGEGEGEAPTSPRTGPVTVELGWSASSNDLDVRGVKKGSDGRFCVTAGFFPNGAVTTGHRASICAPATECSYSTCITGTSRPDWDASGARSDSDPSIAHDFTDGPGPEVLSVPGGLVDGEYLFGAVAYSSTTNETTTMTTRVGALTRTSTATVVPSSWTELFTVRVVNGVASITTLPVAPPPGCTSNQQCALGEICTDGACVDGCVDSTDCPVGEQCEQGSCIAGCSVDSECAAADYCDVDLGECVPGCRSSANCTGTQACIDHVCVTPSPPTQLSGSPINVELTWIGAETDLDVRGVRKDSSGRFCVGTNFMPGGGAVPANSRIVSCTPATVPSTSIPSGGHCAYSNCRLNTTSRLPDWDLTGANSLGDPRIDVDVVRGFGPENLTIPGGLLDGEYLFGALVFGNARGDFATMRLSENGVTRLDVSTNVKPSSWTELAIVTVVNRVVTVTPIAPPAFSCTANNQCPAEQRCTGSTSTPGSCVAGCSTDNDCVDIDVCTNGTCEGPTDVGYDGACEQTGNCAAGLSCFPDTFGSVCGEACDSAADCEQCSAATATTCTCNAGRCE